MATSLPGTRGPRHHWSASLFAALSILVVPGALLAQVPTDPPLDGGGGVLVDSVLVVGHQNFAEAALLGTIGIYSGQTITYREIQAAQGRLWETGRFNDLRVTAREGPAGGAIVTFHVEEHPVIRTLSIRGLEQLSPRDVWDHAGLRSGEAYHPDRVVQARRFIVDGLADAGVPFANVEVRQEAVPDAPGEIYLTLDVTEGHRVTVSDVRFSGNDAFRDSDLRSVLSTRQEGFLWFRPGTFRQETLERDLHEALPEFYASNGYLDFRVLGDTLIIDPQSGKARLEVDVSEGPQYRVDRFSVDGNRRFATEDIERYYQMEQGGLLRSLGLRRGTPNEATPVFDQIAFRDATFRVEELYRNEGYLYAIVTPDFERLPPPSEGEDPRVALRWNIQEGQPAYVRRIHIEGNDFTHDRVIRERILLLPGDVYSEDRLLRSYQAISGLGFFETPLPMPDLNPDEETGDLDITFHVEEQQTGSINFGTTMGGYSGLAGFIGYEQPNLFGQAKSGSLRWDFGRFQNNFRIQYSDPALFQSRVSGTVSLFDARDRFFSFRSGERKIRGGMVRFGLPVPGSFYTRFNVGYSLSRTEFRLREGVDDTSLFGRPPGTQSRVTVGIGRRTIDHPLFPTVGSEQSVSTDFVGGILGGDGRFTRHQVNTQWWVPVGQLGGGQPGSRPIRLTLGLKARAGAIFGDADPFPFDRFWMGGVQFGQRLRGYEETTITPAGYFPRGSLQVRDGDRLGDTFLLLGAEFAVRLHENISVSAFYDAGNMWRNPREIDPSRLFRGAGLGAELVTPFGPIGLDYAYGFDRANPGWELHFRMSGDELPF